VKNKVGPIPALKTQNKQIYDLSMLQFLYVMLWAIFPR